MNYVYLSGRTDEPYNICVGIGKQAFTKKRKYSFSRHLVHVRIHIRKIVFSFSTKTYVVSTQKNHLNETVLLST